MPRIQTSPGLPQSVFTASKHPDLTDRYVHINTSQVLKALTDEGFVVAGTMHQRGRIDPMNPYGKHVIDLRHPDAPELDGAVPRVLFGNSHDGSMRASIMAGVFRYVCSNGMVVGSTYASERVMHVGDSAKQLIDRVRQLAKNTAPLFQQIETWQRKDLTAAAQAEYARLVATLRWGDPHRFEPEQLLQVRREADEGSDLWRVFNRVQEATTNVSLEGFARTGRRTVSRPLTEVTSNIRFNEQLWKLTEEFAGY